MDKEFVPYNEALALKELGFNKLCFAYYNDTKELLLFTPSYNHKFLPFYAKNSEVSTWLSKIFSGRAIKDKYVVAPLYQQAFRWFREKYNLYHEITLDSFKEPYRLHGEIKQLDDSKCYVVKCHNLGHYPNNKYGEAELYCLLKLIEIVKDLDKPD